jgi:predicted MFS family arabinose efflux permease
VRVVARSPLVRPILAATATLNVFTLATAALLVLYATRSLGVPPATLGIVLGAGAIAGVIGSLLTGPIVARLGVGRTFAAGCVLFTAPMLLVPLAGGAYPLVLALLVLAEFGTGFGVMVLDISAGAILVAAVPDALRARMFGAYQLVNHGVRPLGALGGGALAAAIGTRPTLWVAGIGGVASVLWLLPSPVPRLRALPGSGPAAQRAIP